MPATVGDQVSGAGFIVTSIRRAVAGVAAAVPLPGGRVAEIGDGIVTITVVVADGGVAVPLLAHRIPADRVVTGVVGTCTVVRHVRELPTAPR